MINDNVIFYECKSFDRVNACPAKDSDHGTPSAECNMVNLKENRK